MNKNYFFVTTSGSIYNRVLPLLETMQEATVLVFSESIGDFFEEYTEYPVIRLQTVPTLVTKKTVHHFFGEWSKMKNESEYLSNLINDDNVHFSTSSWFLVLFYYLQKLSENNRLYFYPSKYLTTGFTQIHSFKSKLFNKINKSVLGVDTIMVKESGLQSFELSSDFYAKNHVKIIPFSELKLDYKCLKKYQDKIDVASTLFLSEDLVSLDRVSVSDMENVMSKLHDILDKFKFSVKPHPRLSTLYSGFEHADVLPSFIPSEFILNENIKTIIGIESLSLLTSVQQTKAQVISILDLFNYKDKSIQDSIRNWLMVESNNKILFPKTFEELETLITK